MVWPAAYGETIDANIAAIAYYWQQCPALTAGHFLIATLLASRCVRRLFTLRG